MPTLTTSKRQIQRPNVTQPEEENVLCFQSRQYCWGTRNRCKCLLKQTNSSVQFVVGLWGSFFPPKSYHFPSTPYDQFCFWSHTMGTKYHSELSFNFPTRCSLRGSSKCWMISCGLTVKKTLSPSSQVWPFVPGIWGWLNEACSLRMKRSLAQIIGRCCCHHVFKSWPELP